MLDEVTWDGKAIAGERTCALLRALAESGTRGLSEDALIEAIWGDELPDNPTKSLHVVVSRSRVATGADVIERTSRGYRLALDTAEVDIWALRPEGLRLAAEGQYARALPLLERVEPDDEVREALLRAQAAVRGVPAALTEYENYRARLSDTLGIDPSERLQALHRELLARDQPVRSGIRYDSDQLVGREADIAALEVLVRTHRLVSIVGAGGLGKTRLAHVIARTAEQPIVHFVELVSVASPEGVAVEVADMLGVRESISGHLIALRHADVVERIIDAIGTVPTLLILDNCEHVITAVAELAATLLARTPSLTILTTTRTPLHISAERIYQLPELSPEDAAALFIERATAARKDVFLDEEQIKILVARLDGLPLAVELAAAKVRVMSVDEIFRRLDNRFALLRGGSRDAPERHQTLLAVIDWSWNLLTEAERVALRRLSIFRDGFSLGGACAVIDGALSGGNANDLDDVEALELLTSLVNQSLVVVREGNGIRYRLLETVREFGRMQLVDAGDDAATQARLIAWAMNFSDEVSPQLYSPQQVAMMSLIRSEEGNLADVLRSCLTKEDLAAVATIFAVLSNFWSIEGTHLKVFNLGPAVVRLLVSRPTPPELADKVRTSLILAVFTDTFLRGAVDGAAWQHLNELGPGDDPRVGPVARVLLEIGPDDGGLQNVKALLRLVDDPDQNVARTALMFSAHIHQNEGDIAAARSMSQRALQLCDDNQGPWMRAMLTAQLCEFTLSAGDDDEAKLYALQAQPLLKALGARDDYIQTRMALALIALRSGALDEAEQIIDEVGRDELDQSIFGATMSLECCKAELLIARGDVQAGIEAYHQTWKHMGERGIPGVDWTMDFAPWEVLPQSALIAVACRHHEQAGEGVGMASAHRDDLLGKTIAATLSDATGGFLDIPVLGCALFGLAAWELVFGDKLIAAQLLTYADRFAFSRMFPSFDWGWATSLAQPADLPPRTQTELREDAHNLLTQLSKNSLVR